MIHKANRELLILILTAIVVILFFIQQRGQEPLTDIGSDNFDPASVLTQIRNDNEDIFLGIRNNVSNILKQGGIDGSIKLIDIAFASGLIPLNQCHRLLHLLGHESYEHYQGNFDNLASHESNKCAASFQHGIEAQIAEIEPNLPTAVEKLHEYCTSLRRVLRAINCYHGSGHGYMRITHNAQASLDFCDALAGGPETDLSDCYRGVFSEYGFMALNIDGDTGERISDTPPIKVDLERPFKICYSFQKKYRQSCFSQLTKIIFKGADIEGSFKKCLYPEYEKELQETCVRIVGAIYSEKILSTSDTVKTPEFIITLPGNLRQSYLSGIRLAFLTYFESRVQKDWLTVCESFPDLNDQEFCHTLYNDLKR